ncbi:MAG: PASTA domain-containing protein [Rhodopirellula sp.]|nr:PASTA domain-containing protein [Rhodopirellula sp.]
MARESLARLVFATAITALFCLNAEPTSAQVAPQQPAVDPQAQQLDQILKDWHAKSLQVQRLEGDHVRIEYDFVFQVARRSSGRFYYEAPDKGRIDFIPDPVGAKKPFPKLNPATNKQVQLTVTLDKQERWICDGRQVLSIDDESMIVEQFPIPPQAQGQNIMNGPLPFLFGMEPKMAKQRYQLRVMMENADVIDLLVQPNWKQDAENYKWARVRIERKTMLPMAVQLLNPAGTGETVYTFPRIAKNPEKGLLQKLLPWKEKDPFKPDLSKYDIQAAEVAPEEVAERQPATVPNGRQLLPSVIGFDFKQAESLLQKSGYTVKLIRGEPAARNELTYRVQKQDPAPKTAVENGSVVALTLYMPAVQQTGGESPAAAPKSTTTSAVEASPVARPVTTPKVIGAHWKDAQKTLTTAGLIIKFRQGRVAASSADIFKVYDQQPAAGTAVKAGDTVTLTLFISPELATK